MTGIGQRTRMGAVQSRFESLADEAAVRASLASRDKDAKSPSVAREAPIICTAEDERVMQAARCVADLAMRELGWVVRTSSNRTSLDKLSLLKDISEEDEVKLEDDLREELLSVRAFADGEAGDRKKYVAAGKQQMVRWRIFLAVHGIDDTEQPTRDMVKKYAVFMFKTRQRRSMAGKAGLSDSAAEMAQYTLAQVCTR